MAEKKEAAKKAADALLAKMKGDQSSRVQTEFQKEAEKNKKRMAQDQMSGI